MCGEGKSEEESTFGAGVAPLNPENCMIGKSLDNACFIAVETETIKRDIGASHTSPPTAIYRSTSTLNFEIRIAGKLDT
jgi:hypothetical protein